MRAIHPIVNICIVLLFTKFLCLRGFHWRYVSCRGGALSLVLYCILLLVVCKSAPRISIPVHLARGHIRVYRMHFVHALPGTGLVFGLVHASFCFCANLAHAFGSSGSLLVTVLVVWVVDSGWWGGWWAGG